MLHIFTSTIIASILLAPVNVHSGAFRVTTMAVTEPDGCSLPLLQPYRIHGKRAEQFRSIYEVQLRLPPGETQAAKYKRGEDVVIDGDLYAKPGKEMRAAKVEPYNELTVDGKFLTLNLIKFGLQTARLTCLADNSFGLSFTTETIQGVHYSFSGHFLSEPQLVDGLYIGLVGKMTKHRNGRIVAEANVNLVRWAHE